MLFAVEAVDIGIRTELPAFVAHDRLHDIHRDDVLESLQLAEDDGAMRPWARKRDVEVIAPARRRESAAAAWAGAAVGCHPVAVFRLAALEAAAGRLRVVETGVPDTVDQFAVGHVFLVIAGHSLSKTGVNALAPGNPSAKTFA